MAQQNDYFARGFTRAVERAQLDDMTMCVWAKRPDR